jgi:outer membrane usher protein
MSGRWSLLWAIMAMTISGNALAVTAQVDMKAAGEPETLLLAVSINGYPTDKIGQFLWRDGTLRARRAEWIELGVAPPVVAGSSPDDMLGADDLPEVSWVFDASRQTLAVTAPMSRLVATLLRDPAVEYAQALQSGTGVTLNYDVEATAQGATRTAGGLFEARLFSPLGVVSSSMLATIVGGAGAARGSSAIRLDSAYSFADGATLKRYRIGDFINGGLSWTRPVRMAGVQMTADYSTRPDLITFPLPSLRGSAAVPSTIDVLENGSRLFSRDVGAGPFEVPQLPVVTGAGTLAFTVRDALGRQVTVTQSFYASATLLSPRLETFSLQVGAVRRNWGVLSNDYAGLAASGTWRRGITRSITVEASAEGARGLGMGGIGAIFDLAEVAVLNVAGAASTGDGTTGAQFTAGLQRIGTILSVTTSATYATRQFRDIASVNGTAVARLQLNASLGLTLRRFGALGIAFVAINRDPYIGPVERCADSQDSCGSYAQLPERTRLVSASYSLQLKRIALYATAYGDVTDRHARGGVIGVTVPLGRRSSASISGGGGGGNRYAQLDVAQSPSTIGDWGYRAYASAGSAPHQFGQVQYKAPWALLTAGADHVGGESSVRVEVQGSLSVVDDGVFAANAIDDSFAVVDTDGMANIRVLRENRSVGRTNAKGLLLVPDLRSFDINHIGIEASDVPADVTIDTAAREVRPQDRSGVVVRFPAQISHGALLVLIDESGVPLPVGSTATVRATGAIEPVGYDGDSYVTGLQAHNLLDVVRPDGSSCSLSFEYHAKVGDLPTIGPLTCKETPQ